MGGLGSGRREYATTPTVEECRFLDSDNFTDAVERPGYGGPVYWGDRDDPAASINVLMLSADHADALKSGETLETTPVDDGDVFALDDGDQDADSDDGQDGETERATAMYLSYRITDPRDGETRDVSYLVPLEYTECNFGGVRPWFQCPTHAGGCGRRAGKLYSPPRGDRYLCRECHDLAYRSSRTSGDDLERAKHRYQKAFAKADAENRTPHPNNAPFLPDRPKGMHHDTFEDLVADVRAAREEWSRSFDEKLRDMRKRLETTCADLR
jgi:hypothetical protein